ncbi:MAG: AbrB/MazE/SpoVT family DNA-binding domain-containing protein [Methanosarcinales archaeon Met12]|nr:MAG: AbrB/MazE/SpoVT family DNA-binding domain-containing protein [Methanosarcinales archaeon Met12]
MMIVIKSKVGSRGQIVIPKIARDNLGMIEGSGIIIELADDGIQIKSAEKDILSKWSRIAEEEGMDVKKEIKYGDRLYEEIF